MLKSLKHRYRVWKFRRLVRKIYFMYLKHPLQTPSSALDYATADAIDIMEYGGERSYFKQD